MTTTTAQWLGLCLATESNLPHEWPAIATVIANRAAHPRWPDTIPGVILQPNQFSHFNEYLKAGLAGDRLYESVMRGQKGRPMSQALVDQATRCAEWCLAREPWEAPFGPKVCFYYSPVSMKPKGKMPWWWAKEVRRTITLPGIDPFRFQWGEM